MSHDDNKSSDSGMPPTASSFPPGEKRVRPRQIIFSCGAKGDNGKRLKERIPAKTSEEAEALFEEKHGVKPIHVDGPFYEVKGTSKSEENRVSITLKGKDMVPTPQRWIGVFKGWKGYFNGIAAVTHDGIDYEDNELVRPAFDEPVNKNQKMPRPRFGPNSVMRLADVESAKRIED
jgi:hypothetical protein